MNIYCNLKVLIMLVRKWKKICPSPAKNLKCSTTKMRFFYKECVTGNWGIFDNQNRILPILRILFCFISNLHTNNLRWKVQQLTLCIFKSAPDPCFTIYFTNTLISGHNFPLHLSASACLRELTFCNVQINYGLYNANLRVCTN